MSLKEYKSKRSFDSTPEPAGQSEAGQDQQLRFVVQKHDASHLHYDVRLENAGVLVSWAVPKGPSLNPKDKRLAMMTEDHPYDYQYFEGLIPKGNYGAGQVIVWDSGTYELVGEGSKTDQEKAFKKGLQEGKISFILHGRKLKGEFTLVKSPKPNQPNSWLMIKKADQYSSQRDITKEDRSVISNMQVEEINETETFNWEEWQDCIANYELPKRDMPTRVEPMLATLIDGPFSDNNWIFEVKWDGYRATARISGGKVALQSRNQKSFNSKYPAIVESLQKVSVPAVMDGEVVVLRKNGLSSFSDLQNYDFKANAHLVYYAFDLLWLDGYDMTNAPLHLRKTFLKKILPATDNVRFSDHVTGRGEEFFEAACRQNLEGIIAKQSTGTYHMGKRVKSWLKIKTVKRQETVIGGFTEPRGGRKGLGALILGVHKDNDLVYVGHSGTGLSDKELIDIRQELETMEQKTSPFKTPPKPNAPVHWVKPKLLCEVAFSEWTNDGQMRHPKIVGLRTDKPASEIVREQPVKKQEALKEKTPASKVEFTNRDKIFWPDLGLHKGDLIDYYQTMAGKIMPYVKNRPMTLLRHPNGLRGNPFFQKHMDQPLPHGFKTFRRYSESNKKDIDYFVCDSQDALLYMIQLGCIEINPWNSTVNLPENPDWLVLDLDPEGIGFEAVIQTALETKKLLDELKLPAFVKTSGKTGMHIYLPTKTRYDYDQVRRFSELLARLVVQRLPDITSVERSPSKRQGKVYVDFLQNRVGQTLAAPFSVRPTPEATISMPLDWSEVNKKLLPENFTLQNAGQVLSRRTNPWQDFFSSRISIEDAVEAIEASGQG
ncbi:DNA ligase D [Candidatus Parcubacteria bacterium]|nr:DNA ligase D [Candidatus Parcubacteria bacterium]